MLGFASYGWIWAKVIILFKSESREEKLTGLANMFLVNLIFGRHYRGCVLSDCEQGVIRIQA